MRSTPRQPNGRKYRVRNKLYPVDGVSKDWLRSELGTLAFLVEGPYHNPMDPVRRFLAVESSRPLWMTLMTRFLDGPSVSGRVTDPDGNPLEAEVRIREVIPQEGGALDQSPSGWALGPLSSTPRHVYYFCLSSGIRTRSDASSLRHPRGRSRFRAHSDKQRSKHRSVRRSREKHLGAGWGF